MVCEKQFTRKQDLNRHKVRHSEEAWCSCTQCEKRFLNQHYLKIHMNVHSSKYKCTECGKCCHSSQALTVNRRSHSGEKPFECTVCSKRFTTSRELVVHRRIHSGEKQYKCHLCDKVFSRSDSLNTHMRVHTGDKPYKCSLCEKSFTTSSHLQTHKRHVHSNIRPCDCRYCGSCLKVTMIWSVMFIFTLVQSHTHVDTVQTVLHFMSNSRHICWSLTIKALGSHVTFVTRNSPRVVT